MQKSAAAKSPLRFRTNCSSGVPVVALGVLAAVAGVVGANPLLIAFAGVLVGAPVTVYFLLRRSARGVRLTRRMPDTAVEGESVDIRIVLENRSRLPLFFPELVELFTPEIGEQKVVLFPYRVVAGESIETGYRGDCLLPRGLYAIGPTALSVADPFGWFQIRVPLNAPRTLKVYPRYEAYGLRKHSSAQGSRPLDEITRAAIGESQDYFSVREYQHGDPLRRVHWPLSAHVGSPVVREYVQPSSGDITVLLDLYRYALLGIGRTSSLEHAVRIAASLANFALKRGHQVSVCGHGETLLQTPASSGNAHLRAILDLLVRVKPTGETRLEDVLRNKAASVVPGSTVVLTVSPYLFDSKDMDAQISDLKRRACRVVLAVFDDSTFRNVYEPDRVGGYRAIEYVDRMRESGVRAILVPCAANLRQVFLNADEPSAQSVLGDHQ